MQRGTHTNEQGSFSFLTFSNGKFIEKFKEPNDNTVTRKITKGDNIGKDTHEAFYDSIAGRLLSINVEDTQYGKQWVFKMDVSEPNKPKTFVFKTAIQFDNAKGILMCLQNMDFTQDCEFRGYYFEETKKQGITVYQPRESKAVGIEKGDVIKVYSFYPEGSNKGLPPWVKVTFNMKDMWDKTDYIKFIMAYIESEIKPKLNDASALTLAATPPSAAPQAASSAPTSFAPTATADHGSDDISDDLPF